MEHAELLQQAGPTTANAYPKEQFVNFLQLTDWDLSWQIKNIFELLVMP